MAAADIIVEQDGSGDVLKQQVWGLTYIDELIQTSLNSNPTGQSTCDTPYWVMQDANFNVLGMVDRYGVLAERYEYTAYGQRQVYTSPGSNDPGCYAPIAMSRRFVASGPVTEPYGLCEFGHQGLMHDEETGLVYNRARMLNPTLGRFMQEDPLGYVDSLDTYLTYRQRPISIVDPFGFAGEDPCPCPKAKKQYMEDLAAIWDWFDQQDKALKRRNKDNTDFMDKAFADWQKGILDAADTNDIQLEFVISRMNYEIDRSRDIHMAVWADMGFNHFALPSVTYGFWLKAGYYAISVAQVVNVADFYVEVHNIFDRAEIAAKDVHATYEHTVNDLTDQLTKDTTTYVATRDAISRDAQGVLEEWAKKRLDAVHKYIRDCASESGGQQ